MCLIDFLCVYLCDEGCSHGQATLIGINRLCILLSDMDDASHARWVGWYERKDAWCYVNNTLMLFYSYVHAISNVYVYKNDVNRIKNLLNTTRVSEYIMRLQVSLGDLLHYKATQKSCRHLQHRSLRFDISTKSQSGIYGDYTHV